MADVEQAGPVLPDEFVVTGTEREVVAGFLELYRGILPRKLAGLGDADARRPLVPSQTTLLGLVKHLASVEREWFGQVLEQRPASDFGLPLPGDGFGLDPADTVESVTADYRAACAESRAAAARHELAEVVPHDRLGSVSLRWIYVHMVEETSRHAGHADILRELTDGSTGFDGPA
jgi:uncharacterized damage-inducible protein DinB